MKAKQLFDKIIENWQVKAVCFVIALFLYVIHQNQSVDKRVFSVPLSVESQNGFVSIEPHPRTVAVSARGKAEELAQVRESDLKAYLDLTYISKDGSYDFPVLITLSDSASVLNPLELKVTPEIVRLRVEEEITSYVDIQPLLSGNPAYGYSIKNVTVSPDQIAITGPRTMIENCKSLKTLNVTASNAKRSFTSKTKVEQKGYFIKHDDVEVAVTVEIEELEGTKSFTKLPVKIINLSPDLEIRARTSDVTVTLKGSLASLEAFKPSDSFVTADVSHIDSAGTFYVNLSYSVPKRFTLLDGHTKTIPVTFTKKQLSDSSAPVETNEVVEEEAEDDSEKITVIEGEGGALEEKVEATTEQKTEPKSEQKTERKGKR
ncbi:CdaR family protein [uncultured Treponema sp.]|uniref:CdaR family protein n=1 Tax=uncultured Treponema sp. TaxID=162155 RepID=UPI0025E8A38F|nr:CdaR family protein [uncultured Treponema sp.]